MNQCCCQSLNLFYFIALNRNGRFGLTEMFLLSSIFPRDKQTRSHNVKLDFRRMSVESRQVFVVK